MLKEVAGLNEVWRKEGQAGVRIICGQRCGLITERSCGKIVF